MNSATALLQSAEAHGITLWADGDQLRYKARQPVSDGMKDRIRQHKAELIKFLNQAKGDNGCHPSHMPEWCNPQCECFRRLELPDLPTVMGCYQDTDAKNWRYVRIEKMNDCPRAGRK